MLGEILTWVGVAIAGLMAFALYRSAVKVEEPEGQEPEPRSKH